MVSGNIQAQTFAEWFQQKKTKKKYLVQQIAALQVYIEYLQKGYKIAKGGLNAIRSIKDGDFTQHLFHFNSLKLVNPEVKKYAKLAELVLLQEKMLQRTRSTLKEVKRDNLYSPDEWSYVQKVFDLLLEDCTATIDELLAVLRNGELEMSDDERIERIDKLYTHMEDMYAFCESFSSDALLLKINRRKALTDIQVSGSLQKQ